METVGSGFKPAILASTFAEEMLMEVGTKHEDELDSGIRAQKVSDTDLELNVSTNPPVRTT